MKVAFFIGKEKKSASCRNDTVWKLDCRTVKWVVNGGERAAYVAVLGEVR